MARSHTSHRAGGCIVTESEASRSDFATSAFIAADSMDLLRMRLRISERALSRPMNQMKSPNQALQRTPGFGVQLPSAALIRPAQSRAVLPAMKPGTARAFASRRRAHSRAPGPESLRLGSLGVFAPLPATKP